MYTLMVGKEEGRHRKARTLHYGLVPNLLTPPSFSALTLKRYTVPGSRLPTVHSSSDPWYTSEATASGSVISTLYSDTSQPLSDVGTSGNTEFLHFSTFMCFWLSKSHLIFYSVLQNTIQVACAGISPTKEPPSIKCKSS